MKKNARENYGDIIDLPHYVDPDRPQMSRRNRAAQFSPFAALTGYEEMIAEAARETGERVELDESEKELLGRRLQCLLRMERAPAAAITFFEADDKKSGGVYRTVTGRIRRYDARGRSIILDSGEAIAVDDVTAVEADCFDDE